MWIRVCLVLVWWCGGALPAATNHLTGPLGTTPSQKAPIDEMLDDIVLQKCGIQKSDVDNPVMRACRVPVQLPIADDKLEELPLVCYALYDMALRWCDSGRKFDDIFNLPHTSEACIPGKDNLQSVLAKTDTLFTHTRPFIFTLSSFLANSTLCRHVCYTQDKPEALCSIVMSGNAVLTAAVDKPQFVQSQGPVYNPPALPPINTKFNITKIAQPESAVLHQKVETAAVVVNETKLQTVTKEVKKTPRVEPLNIYPPQPIKPEKVNLESLPVAATDDKFTIPNENQSTRENTVVKISTPNEEKSIQSPIDPIKMDENEHEYNSFDSGDDTLDENEGFPMNNAPDKSTSQSKHLSVPETLKVNKIDLPESNMNGGFQVGQFGDAEDSNFFTYFLFAIGIFILGYVVYHNKNKVLGLLVEGRRNSNTGRRRGVSSSTAYRKLDCTLEEAVSSTPPSHGPNIVY